MNKILLNRCFISIACIFQISFTSKIADAQVVPNRSLGTTVEFQNINGETINTIRGGTKRGQNLFHGFQEFSNNNAVIFENPLDTKNIFAHITSNSASKINGLLQVNGPANLVFVNPNGFIFRENAALQIQGSFLVTTSERLIFSDGFEYYTRQENNPFLSDGELVQVKLSKRSGSIDIQGTGHQIKFFPNFESLTGVEKSISGLQIQPSKSLVLIGNGINIDGGIITAGSGNIFMRSISEGVVNIQGKQASDQFSISTSAKLNDINIKNKSLINLSGNKKSNLNIISNDLKIGTSSLIFNEVKDFHPQDEIYINTNRLFSIDGELDVNPSISAFELGTPSAGIYSQNVMGNGTNIHIDSSEIMLTNGGSILSTSSISGSTGPLKINASKSISIIGISNTGLFQDSTIRTSVTNGSIGDLVSIRSNDLLVKNASGIISLVIGNSKGSDLDIDVNKTTSVNGFNPINLSPALIASFSFGSGQGGNLLIDTGNLQLSNTGSISSSTSASGPSGNIRIRANNINIDGKNASSVLGDEIIPSTIAATSAPAPPFVQEFLGLPLSPSGNAGKIEIIAKNLSVNNGGRIAVSSLGSGNAGTLTVRSEQLKLDDLSILSASASGKDGGNIQIFSQNTILNNSFIRAVSIGDGQGGNIEINADLFVAFGESIISANAQNARGGNITFNTQGFFSSPDTRITATSALGAQSDGTVTFNNPDRDLGFVTTNVVTEPNDPEITSVCTPKSANSFSEFFIRGEGGLPTGATDQLTSTTGWHDPSGGSEQPSNTTVPTPEVVHVDDAQGWVTNPDGTMSLVAYNNLPMYKAEKSKKCNAKTLPDNPTAAHPQPSRTGSESTLSARPHTTKTPSTRVTPSHTPRVSTFRN